MYTGRIAARARRPVFPGLIPAIGAMFHSHLSFVIPFLAFAVANSADSCAVSTNVRIECNGGTTLVGCNTQLVGDVFSFQVRNPARGPVSVAVTPNCNSSQSVSTTTELSWEHFTASEWSLVSVAPQTPSCLLLHCTFPTVIYYDVSFGPQANSLPVNPNPSGVVFCTNGNDKNEGDEGPTSGTYSQWCAGAGSYKFVFRYNLVPGAKMFAAITNPVGHHIMIRFFSSHDNSIFYLDGGEYTPSSATSRTLSSTCDSDSCAILMECENGMGDGACGTITVYWTVVYPEMQLEPLKPLNTCPADVVLTYPPFWWNFYEGSTLYLFSDPSDWSDVAVRLPMTEVKNLGLLADTTFWGGTKQMVAANATYQWITNDGTRFDFWTIIFVAFIVYFFVVLWTGVDGRVCCTCCFSNNIVCTATDSVYTPGTGYVQKLCAADATHGPKNGPPKLCSEHAGLHSERLVFSLSQTLTESASKVLEVCKLVSVLYVLLSAQSLTSMVCDTPAVLLGNGDPTQAQPGWGVVSTMPSWLSNSKVSPNHIYLLKYTLAQFHAVVAIYSATPDYRFFYTLYAMELIGLAVVVCTWSAVEKQHWTPLYAIVSLMLAAAWGLYGTQAEMEITLLDGVGETCEPDVIYCNVPYLPLITRSFTSLHLMIAGFYLGLMGTHLVKLAGFKAGRWCCCRRIKPGVGCCAGKPILTSNLHLVMPPVLTRRESDLKRHESDLKAAQDQVFAAVEQLRLKTEMFAVET